MGGRIRWFELRATMTGQASEAERCLGLIADVTARKSLRSNTAGSAARQCGGRECSFDADLAHAIDKR